MGQTPSIFWQSKIQNPPPKKEEEEFMEATSFSLPPGSRFYPSDEQLLRFYLLNKNTSSISTSLPDNDTARDYNFIKELDFFDYDPFDLPDFACFSYGSRARKRHWYYYTVSGLKDNRGWRRLKNGYWKRKGIMREVIGCGGIVLGMKRSFVFYLGNSIKSAKRTNWVLYEYALGDHLKASLVLHRVFVKSGQVNSNLANGISSCGEESVSVVRHIGIQHDGFREPNVVDAKACEGVILNTANDIMRPKEPNCQVIEGSVPDTSLQVPSEVHLSEGVNSSLGFPSVSLSDDVVDNQLLISSILEGDFLELDDLVD